MRKIIKNLKFQQTQLDNINKQKRKLYKELTDLKEKYKLMSTAHDNEQRMRRYYVNKVVELEKLC